MVAPFAFRTTLAVKYYQLLTGAVMALEFNQIEAIKFGDIVARPKVDMETKLRLQSAKLSNAAEMAETIELIANACGDKSKEVKEFIEENLGIVDIARIQAYLAGGKTLLDALDKNMSAQGVVENE